MKIIGKMSQPTFCTKQTNYYYGINNDHNPNISSRGKKKVLLSGKITDYH